MTLTLGVPPNAGRTYEMIGLGKNAEGEVCMCMYAEVIILVSIFRNLIHLFYV